MSQTFANYVRGAFALFLLGLSLYAGIDRLVENELASRGLSTCGSAEHPCALAPLTVTTPRWGARMVNAGAADRAVPHTLGTAPVAPAALHSAMAES